MLATDCVALRAFIEMISQLAYYNEHGKVPARDLHVIIEPFIC